MGPSTPHVGYNVESGSLSNIQRKCTSSTIPRRPGRKGKYQIALEKCGGSAKRGRSCTTTFQKKIVVFKYMGVNAPESFTRSDKDVCTSGLLPLVSVDASEEEIRQEICAVINNCANPELSEIAPDDFEYINMSGKRASIPHCKEGFEWNGRAVKELAGAGSIYVHLKRPSNESDDSTDLVELPQYSITTLSTSHNNDDDNGNVSPTLPVISNHYTAASTSYTSPILIDDDQLQENTITADNPITENVYEDRYANNNPVEEVTDLDDYAAVETVDSNLCQITCEQTSVDDMSRLTEMFPCNTVEQLMCIYNLSGFSLSKCLECFIQGPSFESVRSVAVSQIAVPLEESPRIRVDVDDDEDEWTEAAIAFYKQKKFNKSAGVRISIRGQPAVDVGGVRRQFFFSVLCNLANPPSESTSTSALRLFEGKPHRLRPAYKASILSSGMLTTVGTMIAHCILLDGQGFPYLSEYCYYYIAGSYDQALASVTIDDVGANVQFIINEVKLHG